MRHSTGLSLIELLVVLVLVSLTTVISLQAVGFVTTGLNRISADREKLELDRSASHWYRESLAAMVASLDEEHGFLGRPREMSGYTLAPLLSDNGELTLIRYFLESESQTDVLWYQEDGLEAFMLMEFGSPVEFRYATGRAVYSGNWPGDSFPIGTLPAVIKLDVLQSDDDLLAVIKQRRIARHDYRDLL